MTPKIKILFLAANPRDTTHLRLQEEAREMADRLRGSLHRDAFELVHYLAVRSRDLLRGLQELQPHILHFSGHGNLNQEIVLEADDGSSQPIRPHDFADLLSLFNTNIKVAMLSCCFARKQAKALHRVLDFTIGGAKPISDAGAVSFSANFYQVLGSGGSINQAFGAARLITNMEGRKIFETSDLFVRKDAKADEPFINLLATQTQDQVTRKEVPEGREIQRIENSEVGIAQVFAESDNNIITTSVGSK
jgi:hypothetical protein